MTGELVTALSSKVYVSELEVEPSPTAARRGATFGQRAAARIAEAAIWWLPAAMLLGLASRYLDFELHPQLVVWLVILLALVAEAACLAVFGNSAGRALTGIRVERLDGSAWDFASAFRRAFGVWALGLAFGVWFLAPMTNSNWGMFAAFASTTAMLWQSGRVAYGVPASYDKGRFSVHQHSTRWWRTLLVLLVMPLAAMAVLVGISY